VDNARCSPCGENIETVEHCSGYAYERWKLARKLKKNVKLDLATIPTKPQAAAPFTKKINRRNRTHNGNEMAHPAPHRNTPARTVTHTPNFTPRDEVFEQAGHEQYQANQGKTHGQPARANRVNTRATIPHHHHSRIHTFSPTNQMLTPPSRHLAQLTHSSNPIHDVTQQWPTRRQEH